MINFKKEMNMYDKFIDKDELTTNELLSVGFTNKDLTRLIEDGKIARVKRGFYKLTNIDGLANYSVLLFTKKFNRPERGKKGLEKCIELDSNNIKARSRMFLSSIYSCDWDMAFECFEVLNKTDNAHYVKDQNLWLYLLSFIIDLPEEYKDSVRDIRINDVLPCEDDKRYLDKQQQNEIRKAIMSQKFYEARDLISSSNELKERKIYALVTKGLLESALWLTLQHYDKIYELIEEENYSEIEKILKEKRGYHGITVGERQILTIVEDLRRVLERKELPHILDGDTCYFNGAIKNRDYEKALKLYEENSKIKINKYTGVLLNKIVVEMSKLQKEKNKLSADSFNSVTSYLMKQDVDMAINELDNYLDSIGASDYRELIVKLIKVSLLDKDKAFAAPMVELSKISKDEYRFDVSVYVQDFYINLLNRDYDKAKIYLDIVAMSKDIGGTFIDTINMKKLLDNAVENDKKDDFSKKIDVGNSDDYLSDAEVIVSDDFTDEEIEKFYEIPDIVENVLNGDNIAMLEAMSDEDIDRIVDMVRDVPNLQIIVLEEENDEKRIIFRYVNKRDGYIDMSEALREATNNYKNGFYEDAILQYESLITKMDAPKDFVYARLGMSYYKNASNNDFCKAIDYLTLATAQSTRQEGKYDFTELINSMKKRCGYDGLRVNRDEDSSDTKNDAVQYKKED